MPNDEEAHLAETNNTTENNTKDEFFSAPPKAKAVTGNPEDGAQDDAPMDEEEKDQVDNLKQMTEKIKETKVKDDMLS